MLVSRKPGGRYAKAGRPNAKAGRPNSSQWNIVQVGFARDKFAFLPLFLCAHVVYSGILTLISATGNSWSIGVYPIE